MKKLRMKSLKSVLIAIIVFWVFAGVLVGITLPALIAAAKKPIPLEEVDFNGDIDGLYVSGTIYGIYDWYCEETVNNKTVGREYLIDADDYYYIGLHAENSDIKKADALMEATYDYLDGYDDGTELQKYQYEIKGIISPIPSDSLKFLHEYLEWSTMSEEERDMFLPYYIEINKVSEEYDTNQAIFFGIMALILFLAGLLFLVWALNGHYQKSIKKYIAASPNPDIAREKVENFLENTPMVDGLRFNREFVCGQEGATTMFGETSKLVWVYLHTVTHKRNFITIGVTYSLVFCFTDGTRRFVTMKNEQVSRENMQRLYEICPQTVFGYTADLDKMFRKDLAGFLNMKYYPAQANQTNASFNDNYNM